MSMKEILGNWHVLLLLALIVFSALAISFKGLPLGVDLQGGTLFQIHLARAASQEQISSIRDTVQQRLDWAGLKDTSVRAFGSEFVLAQIAETDPEQIERLEALLKKQGRFEVVFDSRVLFTGEDIISIQKDPGKGYGFREESQGTYFWMLPFSLKEPAAVNFARSVFHRCTIQSYSAEGGRQYDCEKTYFFIDRPQDAVLVIPKYIYDFDSELMARGNKLANIPQGTGIGELLNNTMLPYVIVDGNLTEEQVAELSAALGGKEFAVVPPELGPAISDKLAEIGYTLRVEEPFSEGYMQLAKESATGIMPSQSVMPWTWQVSGAKQVISLSETVTNLDPYVANPENAKIFSELLIQGYSSTPAEAESDLTNLTILLESGSLPVPVESISKETISPALGKEFLQNVLIGGIVALFLVAVVLYIRYRVLKIMLPVMFTAICEVTMVLGISAFFQVPRLDLAAIAGIIAAVGTGVDDQIVMTDEMIKGVVDEGGSLIVRVKRAFLIVFASATTMIAMMMPIILFGYGLGSVVGFAITTILGVLVGITITRPTYAEVMKVILRK